MNIKKVIDEYQCIGCACGSHAECYEKSDFDLSCKNHCAGTIVAGIGKIFLGMPKGFNRFGNGKIKIAIFKDMNEKNESFGYDKFNIPVWKYKNEKNHIFIRGLTPRLNIPFLHIILDSNGFDDIDCLEITEKDRSEMD